jgi:hypothetical protein
MPMVNGRKKAVSLRLNVSDIKRVKRISQRLGVRDSDVIRYAIKNLLFKLSSLSDPAVKGNSLVPLFLEGGAELVHHFDLDAQRLGAIINEGVEPPQAVSIDDLHLIAMTGGMGDGGARVSAAPSSRDGGSASNGAQGNVQPKALPHGERRSNPMRRYLYDKYLYRIDGGESGR